MDKFFTYPFRYTPAPEVVDASRRLIARIEADSKLDELFREGKMMGVLVCDEGTLFAFSGLAGNSAVIEGFVPPIFDYSAPDGYFRCREAEIVAMNEAGLSQEAASASKQLQDWLFGSYKVLNALGEESSVADIFAQRGLVPPGGTGECAAPKLLNYAYRNSMTPRAMGEFWYGRSPRSRVRHQGHFYPSCTAKCGPLLTWMMRGLEVAPNPLDVPYLHSEPQLLFSDMDIIVVDKPSGMLSVPGKTAAPCLMDWLAERFGEVHSCHRLDQDTSGVMVYARNMAAKVAIEAQFSAKSVRKSYRARLVAGSTPLRCAKKGTIALPLMPDYLRRPCQMVDRENGKMAVTRYEIVEHFPDGETDVIFYPQTGRTHQLRVHAAHAEGLGHPIKGDHLYGSADGGRLYLHAESLEFIHPSSGQSLFFCHPCSLQSLCEYPFLNHKLIDK